MIKEWFTAQELASLSLSNIPSSKQGVLNKAEREEWRSRDRIASGGGKEYHISNLPDQAQIELLERLIGTDAIAPSPTYAPEAQINQITAEDRRNARLIIVGLFKRFLSSTGLGILAAEQSFLKFYQKEGCDSTSLLVPDWVYKIYPDLSSRSLHRWRAASKKETALNDITDKYGNRKGTGVLDRAEKGEVATYIKALVTQNAHLTAGHIRDLCRSKFGITLQIQQRNGEVEPKPLPKVRTFERFIAEFKKENADLILKLTDPDAYKNKVMLATGRADAHIERLNQEWEIDASPADVLCVDGRYNLYAMVDIYSRRSKVLVTKTPRTEASLTLIRHTIKEWGVPEIIKTDNGSDFISHRFQTSLLALGIEQDVCSPYSPEKKPFVERFFGTLHRDLGPLLPGFIGHNVADRKKIEAKKSFAQRMGEKDHQAFAVSMTAEELQDYINNWVNGRYERRVHGTLGVSPFDKANSWKGSIKTISNERSLDILLAPIAGGQGYRTVTKKGIRVERGQFFAPELALYVGKQVFIRHDPTDMGVIYVYDEKENFICKAQDYERLGIDRIELSQKAKAAQKEHIKEQTKEIKRVARSIKPEDFINACLKDANEETKNIIALPKPTTEHTSKGLTEAERAVFQPKFNEQTVLNDKQKKAHEVLIKEITLPISKKESEETREDRFRKALKVERLIADGEVVSEKDAKWLVGYKNAPEYRSQKSMLEDFGEAFLSGGKDHEID